MTFLRLFGEVGGLWERLILIIFRKERFDVVHIESEVGVEQILDELQLGGVEADHSGRVGFILVEWW